ncbi:MAG: hypothetical protein KJZ58_12365 [Flavobacteriales bacterium]|nr:hypothetical protein [Flavobacteriales bacterium]MCL4283043.1 hypothetical protein [Flavobacteriales bacterium]
MSARLILLLAISSWATSVFGKGADTASFSRDSAEAVQAIHALRPWLGQQLVDLEHATTPEQSRRLAIRIAERTDSVASRFRAVFPDDDDGMMLYSVYTGLAAAVAGSDPGMSSVYQAVGNAALFSGDSPYRPTSYRALSTLSEKAREMARATRPARKHRLLGQLQGTYAELVAAP